MSAPMSIVEGPEDRAARKLPVSSGPQGLETPVPRAVNAQVWFW